MYYKVLSIAGSDSGGGAGIQADIKAISATGGYAATAITAITVQNTIGVKDVFPVPVPYISAQIEAVLEDIGADAVKIGMLHSSEVVHAVTEQLKRFDVSNIVLDPVMVSTSGHRLIEESAIATLCSELVPMARVITPNIPEAEILVGRKISRQEELPAVARELSEMFSAKRPVSVLMKAGHLVDEQLTDYFHNAETGKTTPLFSNRIHTRNTHGTGCTLSSAFASFLAQGNPLDRAAISAKNYINQAIIAGAEETIGANPEFSHGPVKHFYML